MGRDASGQLVTAEPVDEERQMRTVLLDRAKRKQDDSPAIAGELSYLGPGALGEADHVVTERTIALTRVEGGILEKSPAYRAVSRDLHDLVDRDVKRALGARQVAELLLVPQNPRAARQL